ncbi:MAG: universal stress protein [Bryobacteraceae bacterium]
MPVKKILFPVDFSDQAQGAARYAEALTKKFSAELVLFHVVEPLNFFGGAPEFGGPALTDAYASRKAYAHEKLSQFLAEELAGDNVKRILVEGDPAREIVNYAHANDVDLILMPSHGLGTFRRFIIGSVTAKVLHDAECPVWTSVHIEDAPPARELNFRRIVCAIDLGPQAPCAIQWAGEFAAAHDANLTLVHATPAVAARPSKYLDGELSTALAHMAREEMEKLRDQANVKAAVYVEAGDPSAVVRKVAEETEADLVVIGRGAVASGLGRLRAHSYAMIRQSPCPVVSV